jgi:DNA-binding beta-propeller fold protein YncE
VTIIADPAMRFPHSVAFTPETNHLVVTNAGANYFSIYQPKQRESEWRWSQSPVLQKTVGPDSIFRKVNAANKMEGGPKGVAVSKNNLAVCSPELGIKIYSFREKILDS